MKGLYLFQRYLPFIDTIGLLLYRQSDVCPIFFKFSFFLGQTRENLTEIMCGKLTYASGGS